MPISGFPISGLPISGLAAPVETTVSVAGSSAAHASVQGAGAIAVFFSGADPMGLGALDSQCVVRVDVSGESVGQADTASPGSAIYSAECSSVGMGLCYAAEFTLKNVSPVSSGYGVSTADVIALAGLAGPSSGAGAATSECTLIAAFSAFTNGEGVVQDCPAAASAAAGGAAGGLCTPDAAAAALYDCTSTAPLGLATCDGPAAVVISIGGTSSGYCVTPGYIAGGSGGGEVPAFAVCYLSGTVGAAVTSSGLASYAFTVQIENNSTWVP